MEDNVCSHRRAFGDGCLQQPAANKGLHCVGGHFTVRCPLAAGDGEHAAGGVEVDAVLPHDTLRRAIGGGGLGGGERTDAAPHRQHFGAVNRAQMCAEVGKNELHIPLWGLRALLNGRQRVGRSGDAVT